VITPSARRGRLALAVAVALALVLAAPFVGVIRNSIRSAFPGQFSLIINGVIGVSLIAAAGLALARVREQRVTRYGAMALALVAAATYATLTGSPDPAVRAVEHFHFVEYGAVTLLFYRVWRDRADVSALIAPAAAAFIVGVAEEGYQWFLPARVGELKDVWLNGVAIGCGLLFSVSAAPMPAFRRRWAPDAIRLTTRTLAVSSIALAGFIHMVHLGVAISDPEAGTFVSRYSRDELAALARSRAAAWKAAPPLVRPPRLSREDQFMTEGVQHVQARNAAWTAGQAFVAWRENLILERYYPSVLDTPSYVASAGHRWAAVQRADAEARVAGTATRPFESAAYPYPVYLWPPFWLWFVSAAAAAVLWLFEPLRRRLLRTRGPAGAAIVLLTLSMLGVSRAPGESAAQEPQPLATLIGFAILPPDTFTPGPPSGRFRDNGVRGTAFPSQPVQGISAIMPAADRAGWWLALSDNGFGVRWNSPDFLLCFYHLRPEWRTSAGGAGRVEVGPIVRLTDPSAVVPFRLVREDTSERWLTGSDFDPESVVRLRDGTMWIGDEFGPWLLHVDAAGRLLAAPAGVPGFISPDRPGFPPPEAGAKTEATVRRSRGFEALALAPDGTHLLAMLEGPTTEDAPDEARILEFDPAAGAFTGRLWRYRFVQPGHSATELVPYAPGRYLVIERDNRDGPAAACKQVFAIRLGAPGTLVEKTLVADLLAIADPDDLGGRGPRFTFPFITTEAVWAEDERTIVLANDNNYPATGGRAAGERDGTEFIRLRLAHPLPR
jgi:glycerophosphoryl diester phosphodiesterase